MSRATEEPQAKRPPYLWWFLANTLALAFAICSWLFCLHVFGYPEIDKNYELMKKIGRAPELTPFNVTTVPVGEVYDVKSLYSRYIGLDASRLATVNSLYLRNYITNFSDPFAVSYIEGDFRVEKVRELGEGDFIQHGFVVSARGMVQNHEYSRAIDYPVVIEYLFPTDNAKASKEFQPGDIMSVKKSPNCATLLHVRQMKVDRDEVVCLTVAPIAYGPYRVGDSFTFEISPPKDLKIKSGLKMFP